MPAPQNVLVLMDLLARLNGADPDTPVVTDRGEFLMTPMPGLSSDQTALADMTVAAVPMEAGDVQTAATLADLFSPWTATEATHDEAGPRSPVVIAPYDDLIRWVTDISYENGRLTLHTVNKQA